VSVMLQYERQHESLYVDGKAKADRIYRAGDESGSEFKKRRKQCYSFKGLSMDSIIRQHKNEYLIEDEYKRVTEEVGGHVYSMFYPNL
jgi:hypothetical protein